MKIKEIGFESADWNHIAQNRAQWRGSCGHGTESSGYIKVVKSVDRLFKKSSSSWSYEIKYKTLLQKNTLISNCV
jgi:hypothetical protein